MSWIEALIKLPEPEPPEPPEPTIPIYGVYWDGTSTTQWTRTDSAKNFNNPNPYYLGMPDTPSSPFDDITPWSGMQIVEDANAGTLVSIPKFWYKISQENNDIKIQIANQEVEGFNVSPAHMNRGDGVGERDVVYVGRYHCADNTYKSTTNVNPKTNLGIVNMRTNVHNIGSDIWICDFATRFTIWLLYLVEFANWNSQMCIGRGVGGDDSSKLRDLMGYTDSMPYHTGTTKNNRGTAGLGTQYRHIEGLWDNVMDLIDGGYYNNNQLYIILNPNQFTAANSQSGGILIGTVSGGYPSKLTVKNIENTYPLFIPTTSSGSSNSYVCDTWYSYNQYLSGGGYYNNLEPQNVGLFAIKGVSNTSYYDYGTRLMKLPNS